MELASQSTSVSAPRASRVRLRIPGLPNWLIGLVVPAILLGFWLWLTNRGTYTRGQLPPPADVWAAAQQLWDADLLLTHITTSLGRVAEGFAWGAGVAIVLGLAVGLFPIVDALISPTLNAIRAVPSLAWVPLLILWMGIGDQPKITLVAIGVFFPVFTTLVAGITQLDRKLIEVGTA